MQGADGKPFQLRCASFWIINKLTRSNVELALDNIKAKGFNAAIVEGIVSDPAHPDYGPANAYGEEPFTDTSFTPNEKYWKNFDYLVYAARTRGIVLINEPLYWGFNDGEDGWADYVRAAGSTLTENYGKFLGQRYRNAPNLIWSNGGDHVPSSGDLPLATAFANGILSEDPYHLFTAHTARNNSGRVFGSYITLNSSYVDTANLSDRVLNDYNSSPTLPTWMIEARYKGSFPGQPTMTDKQLRGQAWQALLQGACGHAYGHHTVWQFNSGWESALDDSSAVQMKYLHAFMDRIAWSKLVPDQSNTMVTAGRGTIGTEDYVAAARSLDGRLGLLYAPSGQSVEIAASTFASTVRLTWVDPATGEEESGGTFANSGSQTIDPPGTSDMVGFLEAA